MLPELTYWPIHWADGMKITKAHLLGTDHAFRDQVRDATGLLLNSYNYGLLPSANSQNSPLALICDGSELTLSVCRAVTPGGVRIELLGTRESAIRLPLSTVRDQWQRMGHTVGYVILDVNPFETQPTGQPDPDEVPLRYPFTKPVCRLTVSASSSLGPGYSAGYHLPIGKLNLINGSFSLLKDYLPPCRSVGALPEFQEHHRRIGESMGKIADLATEVIARVRTNARSGQPNLLASSIGYMAESTVRTIGDHLDSFYLRGLDEPPVFMAELAIRLARTLRLTLKSIPDTERSTMLNYFQNWCNIVKSDLDAAIQRVLEEEYVHSDCQPVVSTIHKLTALLITLFGELSKLSYLEKEKGSIYEDREEVAPRPPRRGGIWG